MHETGSGLTTSIPVRRQLSSMQLAVWLHERLAPDTLGNHLTAGFEVIGPLDVEALVRAIQRCADLHPSMRTAVRSDGDIPYRVILDDHLVPCEVVDAEGWTEDEVDQHWIELMSEPMDVAGGHGFRFQLLRRSPELHILAVTMHHLVSDGISAAVSADAVFGYYLEESEGAKPKRRQAGDYERVVEAGQQLLGGDRGAELRAFWDAEMATPPGPVDFPTDHPRTANPSFLGGAATRVLSTDQRRRLLQLADQLDVSLHDLMLSGFVALLHRYSTQTDLLVGVPRSGRSLKTMRMVGNFVNPIVLRARPEPSKSFAQLVSEIAQTYQAIAAHDDFPFAEIAKHHPTHSDGSAHPFLRTGFVYNKTAGRLLAGRPTAAQTVHLGGITDDIGPIKVRSRKYPVTIVNQDLRLLAVELDDQVVLAVEYAKDLFDADSIDLFVERLIALFSEVAEEPDTSLGDLSLSAAGDGPTMPVWGPRHSLSNSLVHKLVENRMMSNPEAVAVSDEDRALTYAELNALTESYADRLWHEGARPGDVVGICLKRSVDMVAVILAIMKVGAAYLPMDPEFPAGRLAFMVEDAGVKLAVTDQTAARRLPPIAHLVTLGDNTDSPEPPARPHRGDDPPEQLLYVMYTSGSSGNPKGVRVSHRNMVNLLGSFADHLMLDGDDALLAVTTLSFDISGLELLLPLVCGARVVVASAQTAGDGAALAEQLARGDITIMQATPSTWQMLMAAGWKGQSDLRILCGGEALPRDLADQLLGLVDEVWNVYGPTETTIWSSIGRVEPKGTIHIGRPIANTGFSIVDEAGRMLPRGIPGQLSIGGAGVALGYHHRPELTVERFVADDPVDQSRRYLTGDLAVERLDGNYMCLGRLDDQIKIRGHRIELGEIEVALRNVEGVADAVATRDETSPGSVRLVAFVVAESGVDLDVGVVRNALAATLPRYAVPSAIGVLDQIPRTANGKVARSALDPATLATQRGATFQQPTTPTEHRVVEIWQQVLDQDSIGTDDDFFELGGHSLLATQIVSRLYVEFLVELPVRAIFEGPTVRSVAAMVDQAYRVAQRSQIEPVDRSGPLRLSIAQERMWFLNQLEPEGSAYNLCGSLKVTGPLDLDAFQRSVDHAIERHETLRTTFEEVDGVPVQIVHPAISAPVQRLDWRDVPAPERTSVVDDAIEAEARQPFQLDKGPLLRITCHQTDDAAFRLLVCAHHIIADQWSLGLLANEVASSYQREVTGSGPELAPLEIQYADYGEWQRGWLQAGALADQLSYWRQRLAGLGNLELPTDRPRPQVLSSRGAVVADDLAPSVVAGVHNIAQQHRVSPYMVYLAAYVALIHRYSGACDIAVGTPVANRNTIASEPLVGSLVNSLVVRVDVDGNDLFLDLLKRIRTATLDAYEHQDVPFDYLVTDLRTERDTSRSPIFQAFFNLQNAPFARPELFGTEVEVEAVDRAASQFELSLTIDEQLAGEARIEYATDLYDERRIHQMLDHFWLLLQVSIAEPDRPLHSVPLGQDPSTASRPAMAFDDKARVHQLFEAQAIRTPNRRAATYGAEHLTYRQLDEAANQLANVLLDTGAKTGVLVGVKLERSLDMLIAILAVQKTGAAYLPLDPAFPSDRLNYMLADSGADIVVSSSNLADDLALDQIVLVDTDAARIAASPTSRPATSASATDLMYVIYTSGSTGQPKGVELEHRSVVNFLTSMAQEPGITADDTMVAVTTLSFDIAVLELYLPLLHGANVVIASTTAVVDGEALAEAIDSNEATIMQATPTTWRLLIESGWAGRADLVALCGGEALPRDLAEELPRFCARLWNMYGPTETTVWSSIWPVEAHETILIGKPIGNTTFEVLDPYGNNQPLGVPGELVIGGEGLARGYLGRPDLTIERFIDRGPSARGYRTGDLAIARPDGNYECLGRIDSQVKVRGYRIELGEIEAALINHPSVAEAVVSTYERRPGDVRLAAYVIAANGSPPDRGRAVVDGSVLASHLAETLPDYMVPSNYTVIEHVPLTPNKKVDRAQLPAPDLGSTVRVEQLVAPSTATERALHGIWERVLGVSDFGVNDNFFDLGGHSLLATQVASRVRSELGCGLGIRSYFEAQTVAELAARIDESGPVEPSEVVAIERVDRDGPIPLSFAQERMWFLHRLSPDSTAYNLDTSIRLRGALDIEALQWSLDRVVERHETLRTAFVEDRGTPSQVISETLHIPIDVIDLSGSPEGNVDNVDDQLRASMETLAAKPFVLDQLPLLRPTVFVIGPDDHVLTYSMHHIIGDQWSSGILSREVAGFYNARVQGTTFAPEPLSVHYADYAQWHRRHLEGGALEDQLTYWRSQLHNLPILELPTDHARPLEQSDVGASIAHHIPADIVEAVDNLARQTRTSPFMVYMAGFTALLHRYTGATDIAVGTPIANRNVVESEALVSMFVNTLVLRSDLSGAPTFDELLARTQTVALDGYANQDVPFERLVSELAPDRDLGRSPLFQAFFNVQNAPGAVVELDGLEAETVPAAHLSTPFDVSMTLRLTGSDTPHASLEYRTDLFDADRMQRLLDHYWQLLKSAIEATDKPIQELDIIGATEMAELQRVWGCGRSHYRSDAVLHDLVAHQAAQTPNRVAVKAELGGALTYEELNGQADQLARHLIAMGVGVGDVVAIGLPRSVDVAVAMVAINRAGGAFVPLDIDFPPHRSQFVLTDSGARVLITTTAVEQSCGADESIKRCYLDRDAEMISSHESSDPDVDIDSQALAWIMYTSGSTGVPKGIEIEHGGAVNLFEAMAVEPGISPDDVVLSVTTSSFDPSIQDVYLTLLNGASVVIAAKASTTDGRELVETLRRFEATAMFATPNTWRMLVESGWAGSPQFSAQSGGEPLPRDLADELLARCGSVWNLYGLTEITIWSSAHRVQEGARPIPVGPPIKNTAFYVLDPAGNPLPLGVPGELYIGGVGVGRGFRGRPELDAERLLPDPFSSLPDARMYRTGDLARNHADGSLEFFGRLDTQVKIRGHRVELTEIEATLASRPDVAQAVAIAREYGPGDIRLQAYVVRADGSTVSMGLLREHLRDALPGFMVPSSYTVLDAMPMTANLKVDRNALPVPEGPGREEAWEPPVGEMEVLLAGIWEECLGVKPIGRNQNFFDLGGHSLLAVRMFARVEEATGQTQPLTSLFRGPTVADMARLVRSDTGASEFSSLVEVQPDGAKRPFFSVSPFLITTLSYQLLARHLGPDQPVYAFQPQGVERDDPIHQRVEDMAAHYISEMKAVQPEGPYLLGGHCAGNWVAFEMATQLQAAGDEVALLVLVDSEPPNVTAPSHDTPIYRAAVAGAARLAHYHRDGRLRQALKWQLDLVRQRLILRWVGGDGQRRIAAVRAAHRQAHASFQAGRFDGGVLLIRSRESADLRHNDWHLRWAELITGDLDVAIVPGTHATLMLTDDNTEVMASHIASAIENSANEHRR